MKKFIKSLKNDLTKEIEMKIREKINPEIICDWCLQDYKYQTRNGSKLCVRCYNSHVEYLKLQGPDIRRK